MPAPMDTAPCADCGQVVTAQRRYKRNGSRREHLCTPCAIQRSVRNFTEIQQGKGPGYDSWREGMLRYLETLR